MKTYLEHTSKGLLNDFRSNLLVANMEICKLQMILIKEVLEHPTISIPKKIRIKLIYLLLFYYFSLDEIHYFNYFDELKAYKKLKKNKLDLILMVEQIGAYKRSRKRNKLYNIHKLYQKYKGQNSSKKQIDRLIFLEIKKFLTIANTTSTSPYSFEGVLQVVKKPNLFFSYDLYDQDIN